MIRDNLSALRDMVYSGRGILAGVTVNGDTFIGYTLTGRSPSSQARNLVFENDSTVRTDVTDPEQLAKGNAALLLYPAIAHIPGTNIMVAGNGVQTDLVYGEARRNGSVMDPSQLLASAFANSSFRYDPKNEWLDIASHEPDDPNFTPRISACVEGDYVAMHIARKGGEPHGTIYSLDLNPGEGSLITTYSGDNENPLAPFSGNTLEVQVAGQTADELVDVFYDAIGGSNPKDGDKVYRVAAAAMVLRNGKLDVAIRNRSEIGS